MVGGDIEGNHPQLRYVSGWSYRLYWLASFLPDLRKQSWKTLCTGAAAREENELEYALKSENRGEFEERMIRAGSNA